MSTPKHTPGPWEVTGPHSREVITANPGTYKPCMTIAKVGGYWDGEAQANAHLIAAAPAMYEALRKVIEHRAKEYLDNTVEPYCSLVAALAQAEARS